MTIPPLSPDGFLPVGVHDCTLNEIKTRFGSFQGSDRRPRLFEKLESLVMEAKAARFALWLLIDGSFVTRKDAPNDIDLVLVLPITFDLTANLLPARYNGHD